MAIYAVGDVQGCWLELDALMKKVNLKDSDELWLAGDLINRGPDSLQVLRQARQMGDQCRVVLGNHDLHFLAIFFGGKSPHSKDTFDELLAADVEELAHWLRGQKAHSQRLWACHDSCRDPASVVCSAGSSFRARSRDSDRPERCTGRASRDFLSGFFFTAMYGNSPARWDANLNGMDRLQAIVNYLTRMRLLEPSGAMDFAHKGPVEDRPDGLLPWFAEANHQRRPHKVLFGHWAALNGETNVADCIALDTGCVWGRQLTAYCLDNGEKIVNQLLVATNAAQTVALSFKQGVLSKV